MVVVLLLWVLALRRRYQWTGVLWRHFLEYTLSVPHAAICHVAYQSSLYELGLFDSGWHISLSYYIAVGASSSWVCLSHVLELYAVLCLQSATNTTYHSLLTDLVPITYFSITPQVSISNVSLASSYVTKHHGSDQQVHERPVGDTHSARLPSRLVAPKLVAFRIDAPLLVC